MLLQRDNSASFLLDVLTRYPGVLIFLYVQLSLKRLLVKQFVGRVKVRRAQRAILSVVVTSYL
jgi:hypothetical protein